MHRCYTVVWKCFDISIKSWIIYARKTHKKSYAYINLDILFDMLKYFLLNIFDTTVNIHTYMCACMHPYNVCSLFNVVF